MEFFDELQADKIDLLDNLGTLFQDSSLELLAMLPDALDLILQDAVRKTIAKHAPFVFGASLPVGDGSFVVAGATFHIASAPDLRTPKRLTLAILPADLKIDAAGRRMRELTCKIPGDGDYSTLTFEIPHALRDVKDDALVAIAREIFSVGYSWMTERVMLGIRAACSKTSQKLYEYLRVMVPNKQLLEGFVFSAAAKDKDFVVLDDSATRSAIRLAALRSAQLRRSPAAMGLQMMLEVVPLSDSAILAAVAHNHTIDIDLTERKYYQQGDDGFSESLQAVWGTTVSCFPVVSSDEFLLVAFFLTQHKAELEPLLIAHKPRLREIAISHRKEILLNLTIVEHAKQEGLERAGNWMELIGRLLGGFARASH